MMGAAWLQLFLTAVAGLALWRLWTAFRSAAAGDRAFLRIVAAGFLARALAGQVLFWISYLQLPFLRSLQLRDGFWFFASDGRFYLWSAYTLLHGHAAPFSLRTTYASRTFVEVLALFVGAFGYVASVAILLNCAAYLASCLLLLKIGSPPRGPRLVALAALSFGPGAMLWSLQPMKDTLFALATVALVATLSAWQELWRRESPPSTRAVVLRSAYLLGAFYALAGLRWYFALTIWGLAALFFFGVARSTPQRLRYLLCASTVFVLVACSVRLGAGGDMLPFFETVRATLHLDTAASVAAIPKDYVERVRTGFETTPGATTIVAGPAVTKAPPAPPPAFRPSPEQPLPQPSAPPPQATGARMIAGAAAMFLPRTIAQALGLIDIQGGRGLWLFVELDTILFDLVALFAIGYSAAALRRKRMRVTPLFVLLALVFVLMAVPIVYGVSNFGTLFRLRQMLYVLMAMLPLSLRASLRE